MAAIEIIDLTGSDDEQTHISTQASAQSTILPTRPSPSPSNFNDAIVGSSRSVSVQQHALNSTNSQARRHSTKPSGPKAPRRKHRDPSSKLEQWSSIHQSPSPFKKRRLDGPQIQGPTEADGTNSKVAYETFPLPSTKGLKSSQSRPGNNTEQNAQAEAPILSGSKLTNSSTAPFIDSVRLNDKKAEWNIQQVMHAQVFIHVRNALKPRRAEMSMELRNDIGKRVASEICGENFRADVRMNGGRLSENFEAKVKIQACQLVSQHAEDALGMSKPGPGVASILQRATKMYLEMGGKCLDSSSESSDSEPDMASPATSLSLEEPPEMLGNITGGAVSKSSHEREKIPGKDKHNIPLSSPLDPLKKLQLKRVAQSRSPRSSSSRLAPIANQITSPQISKPAVSGVDTEVLRKANCFHIAGNGHLVARPYLCKEARERANKLTLAPRNKKNAGFYQTEYLHVDFAQEELEFVAGELMKWTEFQDLHDIGDPIGVIHGCMKRQGHRLSLIRKKLLGSRKDGSQGRKLFVQRSEDSILEFLRDAAEGQVSRQSTTMRLQAIPKGRMASPKKSIEALLLSRGLYGDHPRGSGSRSLRSQFLNTVDDTMARRAEWSDCSGDITTIAWVNDRSFICGAVTHSDDHNMQYNKPGNLVVATGTIDTLHSVSGHQIPRPLVTRGENSLHAMRESQDPWLYSTVATTARIGDKIFTGSYDSTVKVWTLSSNSMVLLDTWYHDGNVNFVVTSPHHALVATAADVGQNAIRVYDFERAGHDFSNTPYRTFSGDRANELARARREQQADWAYHVATLAWGKAPCVAHLLLAGYSPRSYDCSEAAIPEERSKTGELCLWNTTTGEKVIISAARSQNVFEVAWHSTQPIFVSATSPTGEFDDNVRTQLRLFGQTTQGVFSVLKTLDCTAIDINEVTLKANSSINCYVTASCTDGATHVWDSALSDKPIHILQHGDSIDILEEGVARELTDVGVRFAAWGKTVDRFYTGSSDGVVKAWDVRAAEGYAHVRDVLTLSGGVSAGAFSPDYDRLVIGDSTGKVHLLAVDSSEFPDYDGDNDSAGKSISTSTGDQSLARGTDKTTKIRKPIVPHAPLSAPYFGSFMDTDSTQTSAELGRDYLRCEQLVIHPNHRIGIIQGPNYASTGLFDNAAHRKHDNTLKIRRKIQRVHIKRQQDAKDQLEADQSFKFPRLLLPQGESDPKSHQQNFAKMELYATFDPETIDELEKERVEFRDSLDLYIEDSELDTSFEDAFFTLDHDEDAPDVSYYSNRELEQVK